MSCIGSSSLRASLLGLLVLLARTSPAGAGPLELVVQLDLSGGSGEYTERLLLPADGSVALESGMPKSVARLQPADRLRLEFDQIGIVTQVERYDGRATNGRSRVVGKSRRLTGVLLLLRTTRELIRTTPEHRFRAVGRGWTEAGSLQPGELIATADPEVAAEVVSVERRLVTPTPVYNLIVEGSHAFHIGRDHLLVHNGSSSPGSGAPCVFGALQSGKSSPRSSPHSADAFLAAFEEGRERSSQQFFGEAFEEEVVPARPVLVPDYERVKRFINGREVEFIQFDARTATTGFTRPGRNMTGDTAVAFMENGELFVVEGRHRTIGAAKGQIISEDLGGVPGRPYWLEFEHRPRYSKLSEKRLPALWLEIDDYEDVTRAELERRNRPFGSSGPLMPP